MFELTMKRKLTSLPACFDTFTSSQEFVEKFRLLFPKGATETPENITELFKKMKMDNTTYQIGKTQVNIVYHICNLMWSELLTLQEADRVSLWLCVILSRE